MYEEIFGHFGLGQNPFTVSPDPASFYSTLAHDEALLQLAFGVKNQQGLMVLTGEPGTGKTTVLRYFLDWLQQREHYSTAYIYHTFVHSTDLLQLILKDFGLAFEGRSKGEMVIALMTWLLSRHKMGDRPVIVIDEAQSLTNAAFEEVRMLLNAQSRGAQLIQIVLAGQLQLEDKLRQPQMEQLRQRIMCYWRLAALKLEETEGYIRKRLARAGGQGPVVFPPESMREVHRYSHGIPRVINLLCEHALLTCYADRRRFVEVEDVASVVRQFELDAEQNPGEEMARTNVFCRLGHFAELAIASAEPAPARAVEPSPATFDATSANLPEQHAMTVVVQATSTATAKETRSPTRSTPLVKHIEPVLSLSKPAIATSRSTITEYWREVSSSFVRDGQQLVEPIRQWLTTSTPAKTARVSVRDGLVRSMRSWLLKPASSTALISTRPRKSSAT